MTRPPDTVLAASDSASGSPDSGSLDTAVPGPMAALGAAVHEAKGPDALAPVTVVAPSAYAALAARRALGSTPGPGGRCGVANVSVTTVDKLVRQLAGPVLGARGQRLALGPVEREATRTVATARGGWLAELVGHPRGLLALGDALAELRRCPAGTLEALARRRGRLGDLGRLLDEVRTQLHERAYADAVDVAEAATTVAGAGNLAGLGPVLVFDPGPMAASDRRVLDVVLARTGAHPVVPGPGAAPLTEVRACADPDEEARAAVRAVVRAVDAGAPAWSQAIFHPPGPAYGRALHQELAAAGVAANGPGTRRLDRTVTGAALLGVLELAGSDWARHDVMAWLATAPVVSGPERRRVPVTRWDALSSDAGVVRGAAQWHERLRTFGARYPAHAVEAATVAAFVEELVHDAVAPGGSWGAHAAWAVGLLDRYLDADTGSWPADEVAAAPQVRGVVLALGELDAVSGHTDHGAFGRAVRAVLEETRLDTSEVPDGGFGDGVFVAPFAGARGLHFDAVVLVGMADAVVPGGIGDDALLPESARRLDISGGLRTREVRLAELRGDVAAAIGAGTRRRVATYPRVDPRTGRAQVPSRFTAGLSGVGTRWRSVDSFSAGLAAADPPVSRGELELHDMARWAAQGNDPARSPVVRSAPRLAVGIGAARLRAGAAFTRFDGNVGVGLVSPFLADVPMSATRLEVYAKCPRRFLYDRVLHVSRRTRPEEIWRMEPPERGTLVHAILEEYLLERLAGAARSLPRLLAIAEEQFRAAADGGLVGKTLLWRMDKAAIRRDLARFHDEEGDLDPLAAELEFGTGAEGADPPVIVALAGGREVRFKGKADRVDRSRSGELVVSDYKTGKQSTLRALRKDPVAGGRLLQLPIYALAAKARFGGDTVRARYWLLSEKRVAPCYSLTVTDEVTARFHDVLGLIATAVEAGAFPGAPGENTRDRQFDAVPDMRLRRRVPGQPGAAMGAQARRPRARPGAGPHRGRAARGIRRRGGRGIRRRRGRLPVTGPVDDEARERVRSDLDATLVVVAGAGTGKTTALVGRIVELVRTGRASLRDIAAITFTEAAAAELRRARPGEDRRGRGREPRRRAPRRGPPRGGRGGHLHAARLRAAHPGRALRRRRHPARVRGSRRDGGARRLRRPLRGLRRHVAQRPRRRARPGAGIHLGPHPRGSDRDRPGAEPALGPAPRRRGRRPRADAPRARGVARRGPPDRARRHRGGAATAQWCDDDQDKLPRASRPAGRGGPRAGVVRRRALAPAIPRGPEAAVGAPRAAGQLDRPHRRGQRGMRAGGAGAPRPAARHVPGRAGRARGPVGVVRPGRGRGTPGRGAARLPRPAGARPHAPATRQRRHGLVAAPLPAPAHRRIPGHRPHPGRAGGAPGRGGGRIGRSGPRRAGGLFVVGDPKQSIYRFRRADIELFARVGREIGEQIVLGTNFRSVPGILEFVNTVFAELFGTEPVPGQAAHHELTGERAPVPLRLRGAAPSVRARPTAIPEATAIPGMAAIPGTTAVQLSLDTLFSSPDAAEPGQRDGGRDGGPGATAPTRRPQPGGMPPVVVLGGPLPVTVTEVRRAAAHDVAVTIGDVVASRWAVMDETDGAIRAARYGDVAVLLPARTALAAMEEALEEARIPYRLEGVALLWGSDEVRDILAVLRAVDDPVDRMAVLGALRSPGLACGDDDLVTWRQAEGTWDPRDPAPAGLEAHPVALAMEVLARLHDERWWREPSAMVGRVFDELRSFELCLAHHRPRDHWQRLRWLKDQARLFDETVGGSLRAFLAWAEQQGEEDRRSGGVGPPDPDDDAVRVMTIHGSKGLEFPVVVVAGLEREVAPGARGPTVLWREDGRPELRGGGPLRSAGFEETNKRERELDTLEAYRLLYVAMTRARDHLIVCLHHKRLKETSTAAPTIAARLQEICAASAPQWRRLPIATLTPADVADDEEAAAAALARIRAGFGLDTAVQPGDEAAGADHTATLAADTDTDVQAWRAGVDAFATRRAEALASTRRAPVTTATAVAEQVAQHREGRHDDAPATAPEPALTSAPDPGGPDVGEARWRDADTALQVGRAVHGALAVIDLTTGTDEGGRDAAEVARGRAAVNGVGAHGDAVAAMVGAALRSPTVVAGSAGQHWRELFVAVPVGDGVLEGFVDLVLEDGDELVVVDYKTDRIDGPAERALAAERYGPQVASYALALEVATGRVVRRCVLVFVGDGAAVEVALEGAELDKAKQHARRAAGELLATGAPGPALR